MIGSRRDLSGSIIGRTTSTYQYSTRDRSQLYLEFLPLVNAGQVRLLDHPDCLRELRGLNGGVARPDAIAWIMRRANTTTSRTRWRGPACWPPKWRTASRLA